MKFSKFYLKKLVQTQEDKDVISAIRNVIQPKLNFRLIQEVHFLGSTARNTYVGRVKEFDYFLGFKKEDFNFEYFCNQAQEKFKNLASKIQIKNRGFPYLKIVFEYKKKSYLIDLVPCLTDRDYSGPIDRTINHHEYVVNNLTQQLRFEIKRFKWRLKRLGLYGSNSEIKGLSGYCCEILILKYKKMENIDPLIKFLNDPCDEARNLLGSTSLKTLQRFELLARNNFKSCAHDYDTDLNLYYKSNSSLKEEAYYSKDPHVIGVVRTKNYIIVELRDVFITTPEERVKDNAEFFIKKPNIQAYSYSKQGFYLKKRTKNFFLTKNPGFIKNESIAISRSYNFFR